MTIKEALISEVPFSVSENMLEKAMIDNEVTGSDTYSSSSKESIDYCVMDILKRVLSEADVTEGGYSIKFDRSAIEKRLKYLAAQYQITDLLDAVPTITGKKVW